MLGVAESAVKSLKPQAKMTTSSTVGTALQRNSILKLCFTGLVRWFGLFWRYFHAKRTVAAISTTKKKTDSQRMKSNRLSTRDAWSEACVGIQKLASDMSFASPAAASASQ